MSFVAIEDAIRDKFRTEVADPNNLVVIYDNEPPKQGGAAWYSFAFQVDSTAQVHTGPDGGRRVRVMGHVDVYLFTVLGRGQVGLLQIADSIVTAFSGASIASPIITFEPEPTPVGGVERSDGWARQQITIPFEAETFR